MLARKGDLVLPDLLLHLLCGLFAQLDSGVLRVQLVHVARNQLLLHLAVSLLLERLDFQPVLVLLQLDLLGFYLVPALQRPDFVQVIESLLWRSVVVLVAVSTVLFGEESLIILLLLDLDSQVILILLIHAPLLGLLDL